MGKRKLLDKHKQVEVIREELMNLQATGRKLNDQMRKDKLQQESIVGSLNETNAKLQSKVTQLEEANQGMRRKFESLELKSHEELDSLRGELKEARVQMDVLKSVSGVHNSGEHGTKDEATVQNRPYVQLQSEILEAQKQIKQKDEVIKI